jgi:hypothetical protein
MKRVAAAVLVLLASLWIGVGPGAEPAWACASPPWTFETVTFQGKVVAITDVVSNGAKIGRTWTFAIDPPVAGLGKTEDVHIDASDSSSDCAIADAPPAMGKRYRVVAGRPPASAGNGSGLSVTNLFGRYAPITSSSSNRWWYAALAAVAAGAAAMLAMRRRRRRARLLRSGPVAQSAM